MSSLAIVCITTPLWLRFATLLRGQISPVATGRVFDHDLPVTLATLCGDLIANAFPIIHAFAIEIAPADLENGTAVTTLELPLPLCMGATDFQNFHCLLQGVLVLVFERTNCRGLPRLCEYATPTEQKSIAKKQVSVNISFYFPINKAII